jgi:ubiquinone biosynthesis protein UbiJ
MLRLLTDRSDTRSLVNPAIQISGDVEFVQSVYRLFAAMEIDWQEPLSQVIGDVPVQGLQQLFDGLRSFTRKTADSARRNLDEYLHEESRLVPPLHQVEAFDQGLDDLRLRLDRLQARVQRLASGIDRRRQRPEG